MILPILLFIRAVLLAVIDRRRKVSAIKQVFITLDKAVLEEAKVKSWEEEKRSVSAQIRKLIADLPDDKNFLRELGERLDYEKTKSSSTEDTVSIALKLPEAEYWEARAKATHAWMSIKEFIITTLELWLEDKLVSMINEVKAVQGAILELSDQKVEAIINEVKAVQDEFSGEEVEAIINEVEAVTVKGSRARSKNAARRAS